MNENDLPPEVARLVASVVTSMSHLDVLLVLWGAQHRAMTVGEIVAGGKLRESVVPDVLDDLASAGFVGEANGVFRYAARGRDADAVDELARMYGTKPVTLIRAVYAR